VSRGYGGRERGPLRVDPARHTYRDVGDEALLLARAAPCWVGRNRAGTVRAAEPEASHIILDDGLQNPSVAPSCGLLVIDGEQGFGNGRLIPAGPLRETLADVLPRVDAVVIIGDDAHNVAASVNKPVFRAALVARLPENFPRDPAYYPFVGIGRPDKFFASCRQAGLTIAGTRGFPDHHPFTPKERDELARHARAHNLRLITTAKDAVRLPPAFMNEVDVLPVDLVFDDEPAVERFLSERT
jgi:tetraacyldisaccharide 4'-kinase